MQNELNRLDYDSFIAQFQTCKAFLTSLERYFDTYEKLDVFQELRIAVYCDISHRANGDMSFGFDCIPEYDAEYFWSKIFESEWGQLANDRYNGDRFVSECRCELTVSVVHGWRTLFNIFDGVDLDRLVDLVSIG